MTKAGDQQLEINRCPIWPDFPAKGRIYPEDDIAEIDSPRAGGEFEISAEAMNLLREKRMFRSRPDQEQMVGFPRVGENDRVRLTTWIADQFLLGNRSPCVTPEIISSVRSKKPLPVGERADRILRFIAGETPILGSVVEFDQHAGPSSALGARHKATLRAFAWSESSRWLELHYLLEYLVGKGLVENIYQSGFPTNYYRVTVEGHSEIARKATLADSSDVFVAMWFDECMDAAYYEGIEPAIRAAGYNPIRIDIFEHTGQIEDAILAKIRKSSFAVVDLTQGHAGTRGGVYFEAGFAFGLGRTVIYTCRRDKFDKVHFDTSHQAHILWTDYGDLRAKLKNRIEGAIGHGPEEFWDNLEEGHP